MSNGRIQLKDLVSQQLPEFIRDQYPTFVNFLEAYYEFLDKQDVDLVQIRDIDTTLDSFIKYFKAELAHNYPISSSYDTERYLLKHIKDQYLAKGSEASYKLLFRLLYGKDVYMDYPGKQMLRVSDGRWQQDVSLFIRVDFGDPISLIGKTVSIQTTKKISRDPVTAKAIQISTVTANVENVIRVSGDVYEFFLDRNFYGEININDVVKYKTDFQGQILSCSAEIVVEKGGYGFKPGMVFKVQSGESTPIWFKITRTDEIGAIVNVDLIKFGLYYQTDFAVNILPTSAVTARKKVSRSPVILTYELTDGTVADINILSGGALYQQVPDVIIGGDGYGASAHAVLTDGVVTDIIVDSVGVGYSTAFVTITPKPGDVGNGAEAEAILGNRYAYNFEDQTAGFSENGYLNKTDYWDWNFSDGAYVGTIVRQFFIDAANTVKENPALLNIKLGSVAKYPGFYKTNDGFLSDSIYIQDSYYYQTFSYVIRIDEQLQTYASIVRTMLHPSGMALFGEYSINNKINLSIALDSLVKSLGVTLYDSFFLDDFAIAKTSSKNIVDGEAIPLDQLLHVDTIKSFTDNFIPLETFIGSISVTNGGSGYSVSSTVSITGGGGSGATGTVQVSGGVLTGIIVTSPGTGYTGTPTVTVSGGTGATFTVNKIGTKLLFTKKLTDASVATEEAVLLTTKSVTVDTVTMVETYVRKLFTKAPTDTISTEEIFYKAVGLNSIQDQLTTYQEVGYLHGNPYDQGGFFSEDYNVGRLRDFSS